MIARVGRALLDGYARRRPRALEAAAGHAVAVQEATLRRLVATARNTEFGLAHGFAAIHSVDDYQRRVPIREYREFAPLWQRALDGEPHVTWPGRSRYWVKTSGTTAGDKQSPGARATSSTRSART